MGFKMPLALISKVVNVGSNPIFKGAYKICHPSRLSASRVALPSFAALSKIRPDFSKKVVLNLKLPINYFNKTCAHKF
jgi:hypothetical protein